MYLTLTLYFGAMTTIMVGILDFHVSSDVYSSFDSLLFGLHDLISGSKLFSNLILLKTGILWNFCHKISTKMMLLSGSLCHSFGSL